MNKQKIEKAYTICIYWLLNKDKDFVCPSIVNNLRADAVSFLYDNESQRRYYALATASYADASDAISLRECTRCFIRAISEEDAEDLYFRFTGEVSQHPVVDLLDILGLRNAKR